MSQLITLAIHTYDKAIALRTLLENEGIHVELHNINLKAPGFSTGVRVRIFESDLPLALRIVENKELFAAPVGDAPTPPIYMVPVDFSENSFKAVEVAAKIAAKDNGVLHLLHSYIDPYIDGRVQFTEALSYDIGEPGARLVLENTAQNLMTNFVQRIRYAMKKGHIPPVKIFTKVVEGVPEDAIADYTKNITPKLVVMGTRGADTKEKELIGSVTAEVLDEGRFTVLTVPEPVEALQIHQPSQVLFMCNLDQDDVLALDSFNRFLGNSDACITLIAAGVRKRLSDSSADKALSRLTDFCRKGFPNFKFVTTDLVSKGYEIEDFATLLKENTFDLILVPNRRRNAFSRLFNPGLAHKILFHTDIPMLVIPV